MPKPRPKKPQSKSLWCYTDFAKQVRAIADHRDISIPEVLEKYAGSVILKEYRRVLDEMNRELGVSNAG